MGRYTPQTPAVLQCDEAARARDELLWRGDETPGPAQRTGAKSTAAADAVRSFDRVTGVESRATPDHLRNGARRPTDTRRLQALAPVTHAQQERSALPVGGFACDELR